MQAKENTLSTRKVGLSKGKPRIWLEKGELSDNGIHHGMRFDVYPMGYGIRIEIAATGKRKIAGTPERPIIDMAGKVVSGSGFDHGDEFYIHAVDGGLDLIKINKEG